MSAFQITPPASGTWWGHRKEHIYDGKKLFPSMPGSIYVGYVKKGLLTYDLCFIFNIHRKGKAE